MRQEVWWAVEPGPAAGGDGVAEMLGIPVDDDGGEQVETRHTVMLPLGSTVADFTLPPDTQGVLEGVVRRSRDRVSEINLSPLAKPIRCYAPSLTGSSPPTPRSARRLQTLIAL